VGGNPTKKKNSADFQEESRKGPQLGTKGKTTRTGLDKRKRQRSNGRVNGGTGEVKKGGW